MNNNKIIFGIFIIINIISKYSFLYNKEKSKDGIDIDKEFNENNNKEIKIIIKYTKKTNLIINHFNNLKESIEAENKNFIVIGEDYKLEGTRRLISYILIFLEIFLSTIVTCSENIIYLTRNYIPSSLFDWTHKNKIIKVAFIFIIGNIINSIINNIQPFEIFYNEKLIWSGIKHNGKLIRPRELIKLIKKNLN